MFNGKQYIVIAVSWRDLPGELIALAVPNQVVAARENHERRPTGYRLPATTEPTWNHWSS